MRLTPRVVQLFLTVALLVLLLTIVRFLPLFGYTATPGSFSGATAFRYNQAFETGFDSSQPVPVYSSFDSGVNPARGEILYTPFQVIMSYVLGYNRYEGSLFETSIAESTSLTLAFLAIGWLWAGRIPVEVDRISTKWLRLLVISAFAAGTPTIILYLVGWNAAYGWYFIMLVVYLWHKDQATTKATAVSFALTFALFGIYTTAALVLVILATFLAIFLRRRFSGIAVVVIVYGMAYFSYMSQLLFGEVLNLPKTISALLGFESRSSGLAYLATSSLPFKLLNGAIDIAISVPLLLSIWPQTKASTTNIAYQLPRACVASVAVFGLGAASAIGLLNGLIRGIEYGAVFSLILIPLAYKGRSGRNRTLLATALLTAILLSGAVQLTSPTVPGQYLTNQETAAPQWITTYDNSTVVVFTDFRLAGPLIASGYLRVVGVSGIDFSPAQVNSLLYDIYYSGNPCRAQLGLAAVRTSTGQSYDLLMVSTRMTETFPAIKGYNDVYEAAPVGFEAPYIGNPSMTRLYDNGEVRLYGSAPSGWNAC